MLVRWFGQSAYLLDGSTRVFIDPFGDMSPRLAARGFRFDYPPIEGVSADLLLVTHEHADHNAVEVIGGSPQTIRMLAGTHETAIGNVIGVSSEHDAVAGTQRGQNTIYCFTLDGTRFCHLGDLGQESLRPEQRGAIGDVDVLFVPAGGGPTISAENAAALVRELAPRVTIPMHYGNESVDFVEPPDAFLDALDAEVDRLDASSVDVQHLRAGVTLLAAPSPRS